MELNETNIFLILKYGYLRMNILMHEHFIIRILEKSIKILILNIHACYVILMAHQELSILLTPCTWTYLLDTINKAIYPRLIAV